MSGQQPLSRKTVKDTILWPPSMLALFRKAVYAEDATECERHLMRLLRNYTRALDDPTQKRWIEVK